MSSHSAVSTSGRSGQSLSDDDASEHSEATKFSTENKRERMSADDNEDDDDDDTDEEQSDATSSQDNSAINEDDEMSEGADDSTRASHSRGQTSKSSHAAKEDTPSNGDNYEMSEAADASTRSFQPRGKSKNSRASTITRSQGDGHSESDDEEQHSDMDESPVNVSPRSLTGKRSRHSITQGQDTSEDESTHSKGPARTSTSKNSKSRGSSSKRARISYSQYGEDEQTHSANEDGEFTDASEADEAAEKSTRASRSRASITEGVGPGGYMAGAIVRIKVTNFVTYTSAEFFPGPKLNMVIGPNGTGKSTLVCAICLGLGWGPKHLGRAKDLGEFVKHGCQEATIEIELAGPPKLLRNVVICRTIKKDGNHSSFTVDGKPLPLAQVRKLAERFAIQVDNLCQFLPQDKVAEFAGLTPIDLLRSTERAAAGEELIGQHDQLIGLRNEQKKLQLNNATDKESLKNLEDRQEMARPDVERMEQRGLIEAKIELMELLRPVVVYTDWRKMHHILIDRRNNTEAAKTKFKKEIEPSMRILNAKAKYLEQIKKFQEFQKKKVEDLSKAAQTRDERIKILDSSIKDLEDQIAAEKQRTRRDKTEELSIQQKIVRLKKEREEVVEFDPDYYNEQLTERKQEKRKLESKAAEIQSRRAPLNDRLRELDRKEKDAKNSLANLDSKSGQQEAKLGNLSKDSLTAYQWLRENGDKFEHEVFGPVVVTCSVKDPRYSQAVENLLNKTDLTAFTTQSLKDFKTLQKHLNGDMKLHDISIKSSTLKLNDKSLQPPISTEELQKLGFDGWAHDFMSGPEPVLAMLCSEKMFHQTPISLHDISDETFHRLENGSIPRVSIWLAGRKYYQVTRRREYGDAAKSTRVRDLRIAKLWTSQPFEASHKQPILDIIQHCKAERADININLASEVEALTELLETRDRLDDETREIRNEKENKQTAHTNARAIPERIIQLEEKLQYIEARRQGVKDKVRDLRAQQDNIHIQKAEATIEYANAVRELQSAYEELVRVEIRHLEAQSDRSALVQRNHENGVLFGQIANAADQALRAYQESADKGKPLNIDARQAKREADTREGGPELFQLIRGEGYTLDTFETDLDSERARLELTHGGSAIMVQEFKARERQIEKLRDRLRNFEIELTDYQNGIDEIRALWEPRLDALVGKISDAFGDSFGRIGLAGQVTLDKVDSPPGPNGEAGGVEFDEWSILIHVRFREGASLSILDSHRQSGGERAVSTIFYLMALQSLAASPFRVVDEINQGMDPRNERMVHSRLVDIACAEEEFDEDGNSTGGGGGQYFLITPKLLNGLSYKKGMKVLCIFSGEHMPEDYRKLDFGKAAKTMNEVRHMGRIIRNVDVAA